MQRFKTQFLFGHLSERAIIVEAEEQADGSWMVYPLNDNIQGAAAVSADDFKKYYAEVTA